MRYKYYVGQLIKFRDNENVYKIISINYRARVVKLQNIKTFATYGGFISSVCSGFEFCFLENYL